MNCQQCKTEYEGMKCSRYCSVKCRSRFGYFKYRVSSKKTKKIYLSQEKKVNCGTCHESRTIKMSTFIQQKKKNFICRSCSQIGKVAWNKNKKGLQIAWNKGLNSIINRDCLFCKENFKIESFKIQECCSHSCAQRLRVELGLHHFGDGTKTSLNFAVRATVQYKNWKKRVIERDGYLCKKCGVESVVGKFVLMHVDHIEPLSFLLKKHKIQTVYDAQDCRGLWNIENGRVLCKVCHLKTETYSRRVLNFISK